MKIRNYKFLDKVRGRFKLSRRILEFKRPKWKKIKKHLSRSFRYKRRKGKFIRIFAQKPARKPNIFKQPVFFGWHKVKNSFKDKINLGRTFLILNDYNRRKKAILQREKFTVRLERSKAIFLRRFFEPEYFISSVFLAISPSHAKKYKESRILYKNEVVCEGKDFLKKGDLLTINGKIIKFSKIRKKFNNFEHLSSFYEYDYYTQSFVILKDYEEIDEKDLSLSLIDSI